MNLATTPARLIAAVTLCIMFGAILLLPAPKKISPTTPVPVATTPAPTPAMSPMELQEQEIVLVHHSMRGNFSFGATSYPARMPFEQPTIVYNTEPPRPINTFKILQIADKEFLRNEEAK